MVHRLRQKGGLNTGLPEYLVAWMRAEHVRALCLAH